MEPVEHGFTLNGHLVKIDQPPPFVASAGLTGEKWLEHNARQVCVRTRELIKDEEKADGEWHDYIRDFAHFGSALPEWKAARISSLLGAKGDEARHAGILREIEKTVCDLEKVDWKAVAEERARKSEGLLGPRV